jgi:hypothetical protein
MNGHQQFDNETRARALIACDTFIQGTEPESSVIEEFEDVDFSDLEEELRGELEGLRKAGRLGAHLKLALLRDLRHAVAGSVTVHAHGILQERRQLYEGARQMTPYYATDGQ